MADKKEIYADGIGQIHVIANMVRFDFITLQPGEEGKEPPQESNVRIIMPIPGFLASINTMRQMIDKMVETGILTKNEKTEKQIPESAK